MSHSYTAGLMDGEGTVTLTRNKPNEYRSPVVSLSNTSLALISYLKDTYGGTVSKQRKYQDHHTDAWMWSLRNNAALDFLRKIKRYMRHEKKIARAEFVLSNYKRVTKRNGKYSEDELKLKLQFEEQFFAL